MTKQEAIEIIEQAHKGNSTKEDFFKTPYEIVSETLDKYAESVNNSDSISGVSGTTTTDCGKDGVITVCNHCNSITEKTHPYR